MSSVSLSSLQVETGSNAGDYSASALSGEETANEDDDGTGDAGLRTPGEERSGFPPSAPVFTESDAEAIKAGSNASLVLSAAELEKQRSESATLGDKAEQSGDLQQTEEKSAAADTSDPEIRPPQEAVARAEKELAEYSKEAPADAETVAPQLTLPADDSSSDALAEGSIAAPPVTSPPSLSPSASRKKLSSRPNSMSSPKDRLRRSSTTTSLRSQPESDLGDSNNLIGEDDARTARSIGESMAPPPAAADAQPSDAPVAAPAPDPVAEVTSAGNADSATRMDDVSHRDSAEDKPADVPADDEDDVDEEGMPKVKCSDCGKKVGLMQLGEHVCGGPPISLPAPNRAQPLDVPTDTVLSPGNSPQPAHRDLPPQPPFSQAEERQTAPDVPDDAMSIASIDQARESRNHYNK